MKTLALVALIGFCRWAPAFAEDTPGKLVELGSFERLEASGVSYFKGRLAVVDDTLNSLFMFDANGEWIASLDAARFPEKQAKFEDIAFHGASRTFFAVGSHSGWDDAWLRQLSVLVEFRLETVNAIDEASVRVLPLAPAFEKLGLWRPAAMKVEGLAVDDAGETLYVGLREPHDRARIYAVSVNAPRRGDPHAELVVEFDAGHVDDTPYSVSALTWEPSSGGLLITTSTEHEPSHRFLGNRLWFARPGRPPVRLWTGSTKG